jgi:2-polyprenyl-3-methyl-5-hydroxy-6-metoxy-1,4-benzoquinol methylase
MAYYSMSRPEIVSIVPTAVQSVLDVGCSEGLFGQSVKEKCNCEVWGIEPVAAAAVKAETLLDKVFTGFFEDAILNIDRTFDLICFNDVLEHMPDPYNALKLCHRLLNKNGMIIASIPNILHYQEFLNILIKRDFEYVDAGIMDRTHMRFFTKKSMIRMFEEAGYSVQIIKGLDPTRSKKMDLISLLSFGYLAEMRYPQFLLQVTTNRN